jgi:hypothetical protein
LLLRYLKKIFYNSVAELRKYKDYDYGRPGDFQGFEANVKRRLAEMMTYYDDIRKVQDLHLPWEILTDINILIVGASSRIVGQGDIVGRSGYFSLNLSANSVMRGRLDARRTLKSLVADLRYFAPLPELYAFHIRPIPPKEYKKILSL